MDVKLIDQEEEKEPDKKTGLKLIKGGRASADFGSTDKGNWLLELELGTIFLAKRKPKYTDLARYVRNNFYLKTRHSDISILLYFIDMKQDIWVDPRDFIVDYDLHEVLGIYREPNETISD